MSERKWWWRRARRALWLWWGDIVAWFVLAKHRIAHDRFMLQFTDDQDQEARRALRRVVDARLFPPDCVSAGACRGGPAMFFTHDGHKEVFIGNSYEHAADELLKWWREENAAGVTPSTKHSTHMNRAERRAWKSNKRKNLSSL